MIAFDTFIAVDWSARKTPAHGRDSIWIGVADAHGTEVVNIGTRVAATSYVRRTVLAEVALGRRVLVGWDFPLGYPAGTAVALGCVDWRGVWERLALVRDEETNANGRVELAAALNDELTGCGAPFWGVPEREQTPSVLAKMSNVRFPVATRTGAALGEWRAVERRLRARGLRPHSVWQLGGNGSVGSQALLGIPRVLALRDDAALRDHSLVWPYETAFGSIPGARPLVVHAEIWPTEWLPVRSTTEVNDKAQVRAVVDGLRALDPDALAARLGEPAGLTPQERDDVLREEAWLVSAASPSVLL